jgi:hypothetical protein
MSPKLNRFLVQFSTDFDIKNRFLLQFLSQKFNFAILNTPLSSLFHILFHTYSLFASHFPLTANNELFSGQRFQVLLIQSFKAHHRDVGYVQGAIVTSVGAHRHWSIVLLETAN